MVVQEVISYRGMGGGAFRDAVGHFGSGLIGSACVRVGSWLTPVRPPIRGRETSFPDPAVLDRSHRSARRKA